MAADSEVWAARLAGKGGKTPKGTILKNSTPASRRSGKNAYKVKQEDR